MRVTNQGDVLEHINETSGLKVKVAAEQLNPPVWAAEVLLNTNTDSLTG